MLSKKIFGKNVINPIVKYSKLFANQIRLPVSISISRNPYQIQNITDMVDAMPLMLLLLLLICLFSVQTSFI